MSLAAGQVEVVWLANIEALSGVVELFLRQNHLFWERTVTHAELLTPRDPEVSRGLPGHPSDSPTASMIQNMDISSPSSTATFWPELLQLNNFRILFLFEAVNISSMFCAFSHKNWYTYVFSNSAPWMKWNLLSLCILERGNEFLWNQLKNLACE